MKNVKGDSPPDVFIKNEFKSIVVFETTGRKDESSYCCCNKIPLAPQI